MWHGGLRQFQNQKMKRRLLNVVTVLSLLLCAAACAAACALWVRSYWVPEQV